MSSHRQVICFGSLAILLLGFTAKAGAQDQSERFLEQASAYEFKRLSSGERFERQERPLLNWKNPARSGEDGAVFLWTHEGKPAVIGTCFTYNYGGRTNRKNAFRVLTNEAIEGSLRGSRMWTPRGDSVTYRSVPSSPRPGRTQLQRMTQLRAITRLFELELTNKKGRQEQCRLMPKPLFRWDGEEDSGAIFAFAIGTDPEAVLIVRSGEDAQGQPEWVYAWCRFTFYPLRASLSGETVWEVERSESVTTNILSRPDYQREPYITFRPDYLD